MHVPGTHEHNRIFYLERIAYILRLIICKITDHILSDIISLSSLYFLSSWIWYHLSELKFLCLLAEQDGIVNRTACFSFDRNCCFTSNKIRVRNCVDFFVYYLVPKAVHEVQSRYCADTAGEWLINI